QQDEGRRVGRLEAERQVEEDERVAVEMEEAPDVEDDPDSDNHALCDEKSRRAEETGEPLRLLPEPIAAESRGQVDVRSMEAEVVIGVRRGGWFRSHGWILPGMGAEAPDTMLAPLDKA